MKISTSLPLTLSFFGVIHGYNELLSREALGPVMPVKNPRPIPQDALNRLTSAKRDVEEHELLSREASIPGYRPGQGPGKGPSMPVKNPRPLPPGALERLTSPAKRGVEEHELLTRDAEARRPFGEHGHGLQVHNNKPRPFQPFQSARTDPLMLPVKRDAEEYELLSRDAMIMKPDFFGRSRAPINPNHHVARRGLEELELLTRDAIVRRPLGEHGHGPIVFNGGARLFGNNPNLKVARRDDEGLLYELLAREAEAEPEAWFDEDFIAEEF